MTVYLTEEQERNLGWVADVLEHGADSVEHLTDQELHDLAGVVRDVVPKPKRTLTTGWTVTDRNGETYKMFGTEWYLVRGLELLKVPFESILDPQPVTYEVVG